jgi:hypothetical protein
VACLLTAAQCFDKYVVAVLPVTERGQGWYAMRCPTGRHGPPLRLHTGDQRHITYHDLGHCPEPEIFAWLVKQGVPGECLARPKDRAGKRPKRTEADETLADSIISVALGDGSTAEKFVRMVMLAMDGELPEGPMVGVFARQLGVSERTIYKATAEARRRTRNW